MNSNFDLGIISLKSNTKKHLQKTLYSTETHHSLELFLECQFLLLALACFLPQVRSLIALSSLSYCPVC